MAVTGTATAGSDTLIGDDADDLIRAGKGNDRLIGGGGRDTLWGEDGSDQIDGGAGTDTAAYLGTASSYQITLQPDGVTWRVKSLAKNGPTDTLTNVERLQFDDRVILLSADAKPVAVADTAAMDEDGAPLILDVLANDADADRDPLSLSSIKSVTGGTASIINGRIVFTPTTNFNGTATITYVIAESLGGLPVYDLAGNRIMPPTAEGTVTIAVNAVNDTPVAPATRSVSTVEDTATAAISIGASDADGDTLSYTTKSVAGQLTKGSVTYAGGSFTYTPVANANGTDSFTILISDGEGGTAEQIVTVSIAAVNDGPTAPATRSVTTTEDTASALIAIGAADVDGDSLTYSTKAVPGQLAKGSVAYANGGFTYTPLANANGTDTFTILISDGRGGTAEQVVTVSIASVNDSPTGQPIVVGTPKLGETLWADGAGITDADGLTRPTYTWQVQDGAGWAGVGTGASYTVGASDIGKALRVVASYTDGGGTAESVASAPTAAVQSSLRMIDSVVYAGAQYSGYSFGAQLESEGGLGPVAYATVDNPDAGGSPLISFFDTSGYFHVQIADLPAGTIIASTILASDGTGATDIGTVTLNRIEASVPGFVLQGGEGGDIFLLPAGNGTVITGGGSDLVFAANATGSIVVEDSGGDQLTVHAEWVTGDLSVQSGAERVYLLINDLAGALTIAEGTPVSYGVISRVGGLTLGSVEALQASYISGDVNITVAQDGSAQVNYVAGNAWLIGQGVKSVSHVDGFVFISGGGTLVASNVSGTATLMGAESSDTLLADEVLGGAALDGRGGHDYYGGPGAVAATGRTSFNTVVLRSGEVEYDIIAGFDGLGGGTGDQLMLVGYGNGSITLESTTTQSLYSTEYYDVATSSYVYGPLVEFVYEKVWRIDGTEDRFTTVSNTWQTVAQDPVTGAYTWTWHMDPGNFDPLMDIVWV